MNADAIRYAVNVIRHLGELTMHVADLVRSGKAERVAEILPPTLLMTQERALAEAKAEARFHGET